MERKVIKINLMGAILTLVLIIAFIIGVIVFAIKLNSDKSESESDGKEQTSELQNNEDNKNDYKELDKKELVMIDGNQKEITMRDYTSQYGYIMSYDIDSFYKDPNDEEKESFKSLVSNTISIDITYFNEDFPKKANELLEGIGRKKAENSQYNLDTKDINGSLCYVEDIEKENGINRNYYLENGEAYYIINVRCGKEFVTNNMPIIEKMIQSIRTF